MICKKAKQIVKEREKEEEKLQQIRGKIKEEVLFAIDKDICPYCGREDLEIGSLFSVIIGRWSKKRCPNCKIWFIAAWNYDSYYDFRITRDKK